MSFENNTIIPAAASNDINLKVDQSTVDLLNAAIASHSQTQSALNDETNTTKTRQQTSATQGTSKRSIDSATESDVTPTSVAPKRAGRKPLEKTTPSDQPLDPKQKRKAQNRAAQRAFRQRKEKHVEELQERIRELEELTSKTDADLIQENEQLKERLKLLQEENYALKDAKFTFEFPLADQQQQQQQQTTTAAASSPTDLHDENSGGISSSSSSSTEQSPLSLTHEDDYSDTPTTKTPTHLQDPSSSFLPFGAFGTSHDFDVLAIPNNSEKGNQPSSTTTANSGYNLKELFHGKDDLFTGYRNNDNTSLAMDEFNTDDFLLDNHSGGLPDLFGGSGDLFGFTQQQQDQHAPFLLDQFYMPDESQPHMRKETVASSLQRAKQDGVRAYEVHQQLKNCPDFNLDALCSDLKSKASCHESKYVLSEHDVDAYLSCFDQK